MRISDWSSDVCSSDLAISSRLFFSRPYFQPALFPTGAVHQLQRRLVVAAEHAGIQRELLETLPVGDHRIPGDPGNDREFVIAISEEPLRFRRGEVFEEADRIGLVRRMAGDRTSTRLNSSH